MRGASTAGSASLGGDYIACTVTAWSPENDANGLFYFGGDMFCSGAADQLQFKVCGQELFGGRWHNIGCSPKNTEEETAFIGAAHITHCTPGAWIRTWAWGFGWLIDGSESESPDYSAEVRC